MGEVHQRLHPQYNFRLFSLGLLVFEIQKFPTCSNLPEYTCIVGTSALMYFYI